MKIFQFINDVNVRNGGAQRVVRTLNEQLVEKQVDSVVVSLQSNVEDEIEQLISFDLDSVYSLKIVNRLRKFIKQNCGKSDIIHAHLFPTNLWTSLAARLAGFKGKLFCTEHSTSNRRRGTWKGKLIDKLTYGRYSKIICISKGTQNALCQWMPKLEARTIVIENGTPLIFDKPPIRNENDRVQVISVGRLSEPKNYENAVRAVSLVKDLDFQYRIAGVGPLETELKSLVKELNVQDKVEFVGFVSELKELYLSADLFLIPSLWEGFGLSAVEAMNAGLPVIASDVEGLNEVVDSDCGLLVDPQNPQSIAEAIRQLVVDSQIRNRLGENGFKKSFRYSAETMADKYLQVYQSELSLS